jgi:RimJ/RimL family protein N-acetyltransferase
MLYQTGVSPMTMTTTSITANNTATASIAIATSDWRHALPVLSGNKVMLRQLEVSDAPLLFAMLTSEEVSRFISPPPTTVEAFEKFIIWTHAERQAGRYACFAVVPHGVKHRGRFVPAAPTRKGLRDSRVGLRARLGILGHRNLRRQRQLVVDFAVETLKVCRLEARACVANGRGNGALRKLGAVQEGVLRRSFLKNGQFLDQMLWSILAEEWRQAKALWAPAASTSKSYLSNTANVATTAGLQ